METGTSLLTLLHLLIPIYWLGGDLGAFYGSGFMTDPQRSVAERLMALKILNNIDMAPRTCLILALPTGLALASARGWLDLDTAALTLVWAAGLGWLAIAWAVHLRHGPAGQRFRQIDMALRWMVLTGLLACAGLALADEIALPCFLVLKLLALATCIALGLVVRRQLVPLFPAIVALRESGPDESVNRVIAGVISRTRPTVMTLWVVVLAACYLGIATPV